MKTVIPYFRMLFIAFAVILTSCSKEEVYEPIETENLESTKASYTSLNITLERSKAEYGALWRFKTVVFKNQIWIYTQKSNPKPPYNYFNQIWSSSDGKDFTLRSTVSTLSVSTHSLVVFQNELWLVGDTGRNTVWHSPNGIDWTRERATTIFMDTYGSGAIVFNDRIYVFESSYGGDQKIYSSANGTDWRLENANAFPGIENGQPIVYKDVLYYVGGLYRRTSMATNDIYKSTNGSDWHKLKRGPVPFPDTTIFGSRSAHAAAVLDDKVYVIGGSNDHQPTNNEIWYSSDMIHWTEYKGNVKFNGMSHHTAIAFRNKIFLMGGFTQFKYDNEPRVTRQIWSIRPNWEFHIYK